MLLLLWKLVILIKNYILIYLQLQMISVEQHFSLLILLTSSIILSLLVSNYSSGYDQMIFDNGGQNFRFLKIFIFFVWF